MVMGEAAVKAAGRRRDVVPGGHDQVARREAFEAAHPAVRITHDGRDWRAGWSLGGPPLRSRPHWQLNGLLDELDRLAQADAERRAIMSDFSGWHAYVTRRGPAEWWRAFPLGTGLQGPPEVIAATPAGLRDVIAAAVWAQWRRTVPAWAAA
jgi:hypothetical protein